jgi:hypothetical protein
VLLRCRCCSGEHAGYCPWCAAEMQVLQCMQGACWLLPWCAAETKVLQCFSAMLDSPAATPPLHCMTVLSVGRPPRLHPSHGAPGPPCRAAPTRARVLSAVQHALMRPRCRVPGLLCHAAPSQPLPGKVHTDVCSVLHCNQGCTSGVQLLASLKSDLLLGRGILETWSQCPRLLVEVKQEI